jgi:hypothetical protein
VTRERRTTFLAGTGLLVAIPFAAGVAGFLTARRRHRRA